MNDRNDPRDERGPRTDPVSVRLALLILAAALALVALAFAIYFAQGLYPGPGAR